MSDLTLRATELADRGGHFFRTDLQVHTPRDQAWSGPKAVTSAEREAYAKTFVAACRERDLHAVAITDHHDFVLAPYIRGAALSETKGDGTALADQERLVVFPGIELTLALARQALLILDANFPDDHLDRVLQILAITPIDAAVTTLPDVEALENIHSLTDLHQKLDQHPWLKGRFIVLPNATDGGHKSIMRKGMQAEYKAMPCVGGYLDGDIAKVGAGNQRIFAGEDKAWGNKRLAIFQTSDSRSSTFKQLGQYSSWIKWSVPTAEALRQACLAQESRISQVEPALPNIRVARVRISNSKFLGRVDIRFNPQFSVLIGGRGTGKSTILDYVRWALCDQPAAASAEDEVADPRVRQRRLIESTLQPYEAQVEVHCVVNGIPHVVRRHAVDGGVSLKVADGKFEGVSEATIQSLLPVQAYSQKQLSSVAIREDELLRFVTTPIQSTLEETDRIRTEVSGRLRENYATLLRHRRLTLEIERCELRERSLADQAQALRDSLTGLSDEDRQVLNEKGAIDDVTTEHAGWIQRLDEVREDIAEVVSSVELGLEQVRDPAQTPTRISAEVQDMRAAVGSALRATLTALRDAAATTNGDDISTKSSTLTARLEAYEATYVAVTERSTAHQDKLGNLSNLERQQRETTELLQQQRTERDGLGEPAARHTELREQLLATRAERGRVLRAQCDHLSETSGGVIRASMPPARGFGEACERWKALIAGSNVRASRVDAMFDQLSSDSDPEAAWEQVLDELESLTLLGKDAEITSEQTPTMSRLGMTVADQKRFAPRLTPDGWLDLSLVEIGSFPVFEYMAKEDDYIPFSAASAGQQASALLATLLAQPGNPLIIDQPEDDLDSDTIQDIITRIWTAKSRRQLIFSSHNANLVVNGDADLVLVMAYVHAGDQSAGHIKEAGAIDVPDVRSEITTVMEGGEKAFRLRMEKYGF